MALPIYQVDAFTDRLFGGNPAAVVPLEAWLPDAQMQAIALENNLSETAFIVPAQGDADYTIRWFTPANEVKLCGHATLATAEVVFSELLPERRDVRFDSLSGPLTVTRDGDMMTLDFPAWEHRPAATPPALAAALGAEVLEFYEGDYQMAVLADDATVRGLTPDIHALHKLVGAGLIVTAQGKDVDFVSRSFFPSFGVDEDPVTGSSHCMLTPYWAKRLNKTQMQAQQVSARGGALHCQLDGDRVRISGRAVRYMKGEILL